MRPSPTALLQPNPGLPNASVRGRPCHTPCTVVPRPAHRTIRQPFCDAAMATTLHPCPSPATRRSYTRGNVCGCSGGTAAPCRRTNPQCEQHRSTGAAPSQHSSCCVHNALTPSCIAAPHATRCRTYGTAQLLQRPVAVGRWPHGRARQDGPQHGVVELAAGAEAALVVLQVEGAQRLRGRGRRRGGRSNALGQEREGSHWGVPVHLGSTGRPGSQRALGMKALGHKRYQSHPGASESMSRGLTVLAPDCDSAAPQQHADRETRRKQNKAVGAAAVANTTRCSSLRQPAPARLHQHADRRKLLEP